MKRPVAALLFVAWVSAPILAQPAPADGTPPLSGPGGAPTAGGTHTPPSPQERRAPTGGAQEVGAAQPAGGTGETAKKPLTAEELLKETVGLDIDTAGYYELVAWCKRLDLPTAGTKSDLQARLEAYYKVTPEAATAAGKKAGQVRTITIKSADSTRYFTIERINQKYIRLTGKVELSMYDPKTGDTHTIKADTILFNEAQKSITASGNVEYELTGKGKSEIFHGQSLTFDVDTWAGIFFSGVSSSKKTIDKNSITFYFSGKEITRSSKDVVTMNDGTITSSDSMNPDWKIDASRIWVLAPGEWALANAVLYVGRVPLLYFPGFFHPGDNLLFHPSFGSRSEVGEYLQTTTYLLGRRPKSSSSLSFLQVAEDTNQTYNTVVNGLFLHKTNPVTPAQLSSYPYNAEKSYVKVLADIYSNLGYFGGLEAKLAGLGILTDSDLDLGIARSRNIYTDPATGTFTPFYENTDGTFSDTWNTSYLFGNPVPFRYGFNADFNLQGPTFQVTGSFPYYSDPYFVRDFGNREEQVDWSQLLGLNQVNQSLLSQQLQSQVLSSLQWTLHTQFTPKLGSLKPFISSLSVTNADLQMYWQTQQNGGLTTLPTLPNNYTYSPDYFYPNREFFYPTSYVIPNIAAQIAGTIFGAAAGTTGATSTAPSGTTSSPPATGSGTSGGQGSAQPPGGTPATGAPAPSSAAGAQAVQSSIQGAAPTGSAAEVAGGGQGASATESPGQAGPTTSAPAATGNLTPRPPWQATTRTSPQVQVQSVRVPDYRGDLLIAPPASNAPYTQSLTYSIVPNLSVENYTVSSGWTDPSQINLGQAYSVFTTQGTAALQYNSTLYGGYGSIADAVTFSGNYKMHYNQAAGISSSEWQSFLLQDYASTFLKATNALTLTAMPFLTNPILGGSQITYSLTNDLFDRTFVPGSLGPTFKDTFLKWDANHVSAHSLDFALKVLPSWGQQQTVTVDTTLPPLVPEVDTSEIFATGPLTSTLTSAVYQPTGSSGWQWKSAEANLAFSSWVVLDQLFTYNYLIPGWSTSTSTATLSAFSNNLSLSESLTYDLQNHIPLDSTTKFTLWYFTAQFEAQETYPYVFSPSSGWVQQQTAQFLPSSFSAGLNYSYTSQPLWKNRIRWSTSVASSYNISLLRFTENLLDFNFSFGLSIYKFLDVTFSVETTNAATYRYFPGLSEQIGQAPLDPFSDLLDSFNFFDTAARQRSNFKMKSISLSLVHHLGDWDLSLQYSGSPQLVYGSGGTSSYQWVPTLTIAVQWKPVPELKSNITDTQGQLTF